jgi:hypothetical protein
MHQVQTDMNISKCDALVEYLDTKREREMRGRT